ncbi:MarR family transcriptional regulator [Heliobacterium gestii]|uniref:MarR family transcriptional regulator n=1 Tax=Heliomicrobium gestii TaxID=2699 RepID=A0A845LIS4_HELGE|nr:MarR family winged helix-turn-helix transcriptional regulator [Heliomicrobium gestii]MBM7868278.1 DNA-binding MarR family transcriptional regulator [Heliomicrobium gestii]MZP44469.1 MarR family transcriptional regulator [Heliomicrobium gestii]
MTHIQNGYPHPPSPCNCMNVRRASRAVTQFYDEVLQPSGLTTAQMALLRNLDQQEPMTMSELAKTMRIDRTTLNRNLKPLADAGLIAVNPGKDSRTRVVTLTATGHALLGRAWALWEEAQASIQEYMGEEELAKLTELLSKLEALAP